MALREQLGRKEGRLYYRVLFKGPGTVFTIPFKLQVEIALVEPIVYLLSTLCCALYWTWVDVHRKPK
jgi:hypothetical protein